MVRGTTGYAEHAPELIERYDALPFTYKHEAVLHLLPSEPTAALDIGAGTGSDAAWLASQGHAVVAVEPADAFRAHGLKKHRSNRIEWVSDALPQLERVAHRSQQFGLVMVTAVWMHLDEHERAVAMPVVASLLAPGGTLIMALRHGQIPEGRVMFAVSADETVALANSHGLRCVLNVAAESKDAPNRAAGVTWSRLAFVPESVA